MKQDPNLDQKEFDRLLEWLSRDTEAAGRIYVELCEGLNRFFQIKGCHDPERLTDATIDRVAQKLTSLKFSAASEPVKFCYGVAKNIYFEYLKFSKRNHLQLDRGDMVPSVLNDTSHKFDPRLDCLDECVNGLSSDDAELVLAYYENEKGEKVRARREIAENLKINIGNLAVRITRLRSSLRKCMEICLKTTEKL